MITSLPKLLGCTPLERWTLEELSGVMHVPPGLLRRRLGFWTSQGVLKEESTDTFTVVEKQKGQQRIPGNNIMHMFMNI